MQFPSVWLGIGCVSGCCWSQVTLYSTGQNTEIKTHAILQTDFSRGYSNDFLVSIWPTIPGAANKVPRIQLICKKIHKMYYIWLDPAIMSLVNILS